jgi:polyisoprenoid-binding protein YceI
MRCLNNRVALTATSLGLSLSPVFAASETFVIDSSHTFPMFEVKHKGLSMHRGRFNKTVGTIALDEPNKSGTVDVTIDAASVSTGDERLEKSLRGDSFFQVTKFPKLIFRSQRLIFEGNTLKQADGELTLLGVSSPVSLKVNALTCKILAGNSKVCGADLSASLKRSSYGMTAYLPDTVGDEVKITIQLEAYKTNAEGGEKS